MLLKAMAIGAGGEAWQLSNSAGWKLGRGGETECGDHQTLT